MRATPIFATALFFATSAFSQGESEKETAPSPNPAEIPTPKSKTPPPAGGIHDPVTRIKQIDAENFSLDDIHFNRATREIRFPAKVNMTKDLIEYIIVTEKGKTHESLLSTTTSPFVLNIVLLLCRYQPSAEGLIQFIEREGPDGGGGGAPAEPQKAPENPLADPNSPAEKPDARETGEPAPEEKPAALPKKSTDNLVQIFVRYESDGKVVENLIDDWILNTETKSSLADVFWVYTGSDILEGGDFGAEIEGSITAIYVDRLAMFNNPIKGNDNDDIWEPFTKRMPPVDTPLEVVLRPFKPKGDPAGEAEKK